MRFTSRLCKFAITAFLAVFCAAAASPVGAQGPDDEGKLSAAVRELAEQIKTYMKNDAQSDTIALGAFTAAEPGANFGGGIKQMLADELKKGGISVGLNARFSCKGEFTFFSDNGPDGGKVTIEAVLREKNIKKKTLTVDIFDVSDIAALIGGTGKLSAKPEKRFESLVTTTQKPEPKIEATLVKGGGDVPASVRAAEDGQFAVEVWRLKADRLEVSTPADSDYEPVPVEELDGGLLFVGLEQENRYAVRLINNTKRLAAATVTIDGLNMFAFSQVPAYKALGKVLVPPGPNGVIIKGWFHTPDESFAFEVCDVGDAAVTKLRGAGLEVEEEVGVITVRFADAIDVAKGETPLADEPPTASVGTKKGPVVGQKYGEMNVKIGIDREVISLRYSHPLPGA